jgi:anti-sigma factor RsiW
MNMQQPEHITYRELLYLEPAGELKAGERSLLQQHLAVCAECRTEQQELAAINLLVAKSAIEVEESFTQEVMEGLPATGWETRSPRTWWAALVAVLLLAVGSAVLIGTGSQDMVSALPLAAVAAVWELLSSSALAGAGMVAASWKGLGIAFQEVLGRSVWNIIAFGVIVISLDLLLLRFLLRTPPAQAGVEDEQDSRP